VKVNIILACDDNGVIGVNGALPWNIPDDLKRFKTLTMGHAVIMGRKTWMSLPVWPLPGRDNIVVCSRENYGVMQGADFVARASLASALSAAKALGHTEAFVIGGARLFEEAFSIADTIHLTLVNTPAVFNTEDEVVAVKLPTSSQWQWQEGSEFPDHLYHIYNRRQSATDITTSEKNHD
jgi:dihydrofolate reductase